MNEIVVSIVRAGIAFIILLIYTRILGKQEVSQLTFFDYIIGITVGSIAATITTSLDIRLLPQIAGLTTWVAFAFLLQYISIKSRWLSKILEGEPVVLIQNGQILEKNMAKSRYRTTDLLEQLRMQGAFNIADVEFAILEMNGNLSVLKKSQNQPLTPSDLYISTQYIGVPTEVILEGRIISQNLEDLKLDENWLLNEIKKQGISNLKEIHFASLDSSGKLYVDKYKDSVRVPPDISDYEGPY